MTEEEYFRKHYPDSCYGDRPLSPYWDYFQDGVEFGERQSEKKIKDLVKENAELEEKINILENCDRLGDMITEAYKEQLTKAKELLKEAQGYIENEDDELYDKIEQLLKEIEK